MVNELIKKLTGIFIEEEKSKCTEQDQLVKNAFSVYARVFNKECLGWQHNLEWNEMFLKQQQRYCNDKLRLRGHLFLNEVFDTPLHDTDFDETEFLDDTLAIEYVAVTLKYVPLVVTVPDELHLDADACIDGGV